MRTVTFKSVYDAILQRLGLDPTGDAITQDTARAITEHITSRVATAWLTWDWPQLTITEERAYRAPWYFSVQYSRKGENGLPDEVYYWSQDKYFKVKASASTDPPVGTPPANAIYWEPLDPVTMFVAIDQPGKLPLGKVIGVYKSDPSLNGSAPHDICLKFRPSQKGVFICYGPLTTVFVCYVPPPPEYSMIPWIGGKAYVPGDRVFWFETGECYRCIQATSNFQPSAVGFWSLEPVPDIFASYLKAGVTADCMKETFTTGEDQIRLARAGAYNNEAESCIQAEIDDLLEQGQKHYYIKPYWSDGWCLSEPWLGSVVLPLTTQIQSDTQAPSAPLVVSAALPMMIYQADIVSLTGPAQPSLQAFPSLSYPIDTLIKITIDAQEQSWRIDPGPKDAADPGQISPDDYNVVSNNKHYTKVL
jgi:hypothetical protein